jgi:DNA polymerase-1
VIPRFVCATIDGPNHGPLIASNADDPLQDLLDLFEGADPLDPIIIQAAAFDLTVLMRYTFDVERGLQKGDPKIAKALRLAIWRKLEENLEREYNGQGLIIRDTSITEKLLTLSTTGNLEGIKTNLDVLAQKYLGIDLGHLKHGPDIWRLRYAELDGIPSAQWPPEATDYAIGDATYAYQIHLEQMKIITPEGPGSANSESLQIYADTALRLSSSHGILIDRPRVTQLAEFLHEQVTPAKLKPLIDAKILRPNGSCDMKALRAEVETVCFNLGRSVPTTEGGAIATATEDLEDLAPHSPLLACYLNRQEYQKLLTAFLPNLQASTVFTNYDILKETGRVSSYGGNEKKKSPYNAVNIQQLPRLEGVRESFRARPGYVQCSTDYTALELCSVGQVCMDLFGYSVHAERINQGYDLHTFLGSALAAYLEPDLVGGEIAGTDEAYRTFMRARKGKGVLSVGYQHQLSLEYAALVSKTTAAGEDLMQALIKERAKHFRTMSKPLGLGFPGMIGPQTMSGTAKTTYGVDLTVEMSKECRELWRSTYPEAKDMRRWVDGQKDRDGTYSYETSFLKRWRAGATFNACANGKFMQSLSADGAKVAACWLARAMYGGLEDDNEYRLLEGVRMLAFIHDEFITEIPVVPLLPNGQPAREPTGEDWALVTKRAMMIADLQCRAMAWAMPHVTFTTNAKDFSDPDAKPSVEPALMFNWTKAADPVWKEIDGHRVLVPWEMRK